jgi:NADH-quinone oxidoreductase subunit L
MLWLVPLLPLLLAPMLYAWWQNAGRATAAISAGSVGILVAGLVLAALDGNWTGSYRWSDTLSLQLGITNLTAVFALTLPLVATPILIYAAAHEQRQGLARLMALLTGFIGAMELLVLAQDLLTLLIAWELVGALSWALIAHHGSDLRRAEHARWAFLITRFGDLGLYIAAAVAFSETGAFAYNGLAQLEGTALDLFVGGVVLAAASKSAQLPFSPWLFAAMSGPTSASALLHSATMVAAGVYLIAQLHTELAAAAWFGPLALWLGLATALAGSLVALFQPHAKRLLAASTSAHHGLMWVAVGAGYPAVAALHFIAHALAKAPLFLAVGVAGERAGTYRLEDLRLGRALPGLAVASLIAALALAGLFPLGAAWTKEAVVTAAGHYSLWAAVLTALAGGLSAAYAARFQLSVFGRRNGTVGIRQGASEGLERSPVYLFAAASLLAGLLWVPGVRDTAGGWLGAEIPSFKAWELVLSLGLVVLGLLLGARLSDRLATSGDKSSTSPVADWLGLPTIARQTLAEPTGRFARGLARADDRWDGVIFKTGRAAIAAAALLARGDDRVVDAGVHASGRFGIWLAEFNSRAGEWLFDELPEGAARWSGRAARYAGRLQSGMVHHYYSIVATGFAAIAVTFILGELL